MSNIHISQAKCISIHQFEEWLIKKCLQIFHVKNPCIFLHFQRHELNIYQQMGLYSVQDVITYVQNLIIKLSLENWCEYSKFFNMIGQCKVNGLNKKNSTLLSSIEKETGYFVFVSPSHPTYQAMLLESLSEDTLSHIKHLFDEISCVIKDTLDIFHLLDIPLMDQILKEINDIWMNAGTKTAINISNLWWSLLQGNAFMIQKLSNLPNIQQILRKQQNNSTIINSAKQLSLPTYSKFMFNMSQISDILKFKMLHKTVFGVNMNMYTDFNINCNCVSRELCECEIVRTGIKRINDYYYNQRATLQSKLQVTNKEINEILELDIPKLASFNNVPSIKTNNLIKADNMLYCNSRLKILKTKTEKRIYNKRKQQNRMMNIQKQVFRNVKHRYIDIGNDAILPVANFIENVQSHFETCPILHQSRAFHNLIKPQSNHSIHIDRTYQTAQDLYQLPHAYVIMSAMLHNKAVYKQTNQLNHSSQLQSLFDEKQKLCNELKQIDLKMNNLVNQIVKMQQSTELYKKIEPFIEEYIQYHYQKLKFTYKKDNILMLLEFLKNNKTNSKSYWSNENDIFGMKHVYIEPITDAFSFTYPILKWSTPATLTTNQHVGNSVIEFQCSTIIQENGQWQQCKNRLHCICTKLHEHKCHNGTHGRCIEHCNNIFEKNCKYNTSVQNVQNFRSVNQ